LDWCLAYTQNGSGRLLSTLLNQLKNI
jgi:hypothetical protein